MVGDCGMLKEKVVSQSYHRIYSKAVKLLPAEITEVYFFVVVLDVKYRKWKRHKRTFQEILIKPPSVQKYFTHFKLNAFVGGKERRMFISCFVKKISKAY